MVEHSAVNRSVVGSSPTGGAYKTRKCDVYGFYFILKLLRKLQDCVIYRVNPVKHIGTIKVIYYNIHIEENKGDGSMLFQESETVELKEMIEACGTGLEKREV